MAIATTYSDKSDQVDWSQTMKYSPVIKQFKNALEEIRKGEIARYVEKLSIEDSKLFDPATKNIIQKVIKLPVLQMKAACKRGEADDLAGILRQLFDLEKTKAVS